jgi:hypothetical protein
MKAHSICWLQFTVDFYFYFSIRVLEPCLHVETIQMILRFLPLFPFPPFDYLLVFNSAASCKVSCMSDPSPTETITHIELHWYETADTNLQFFCVPLSGSYFASTFIHVNI